MKIRSLLFILALILSIGLVMGLASCEEEPAPEDPGNAEQPGGETPDDPTPDDTPHVHEFGNWTVIKAATCGAKGQRLRVCSCGEREYATDFATEDHRYGAENKCVVCNDPWEYYEELTYELNADGVSYAIVGFGGSIGEELALPCFYNGLPVTVIGRNAFKACESLTELNLTDYITTIGDGAFENCAALTTVHFEKNSHLTVIGSKAFAKTAITAFEIPANVIAVGDGAFANCRSLEDLTVAEGNSRYTVSKNGSLVDMAAKALLRVGSVGAIPTDVAVTSIAAYAFAGCGVDEIVVTSAITALAPNAFADCGATKVKFSNTEGWTVHEDANAAGTAVTVTDTAENLSNLTDDYADCYWRYTKPAAE